MTTQLAVCEPRAGAHAEPALRPGVEEPLRGGWRRATLRDAQGSQGGRGPTGAAGRGPKRAAEANGQVRRHVDAAACRRRRASAVRPPSTACREVQHDGLVIREDPAGLRHAYGRPWSRRRRKDVVCGVWAHARVGRAGKLHQWPRAAANSCRKRAGRSQLSRTAEERLRNCWAAPRGTAGRRGGYKLKRKANLGPCEWCADHHQTSEASELRGGGHR